MNGFHDVRLPEHIERGAVGGPQFSTTIVTMNSGYEQRNINWSKTRAKYNIAYAIAYKEDLDDVINFFYARYGRAYGFRFKDWSDYEVASQIIGYGDDSTVAFQAYKTYTDGTYTFDRTLNKLVTGTIAAYVEGVAADFTVDVDTGIITLDTAPASTGGSGPSGEEVVTFDAEFDVPVRFDIDALEVNMELWNVGSVPSIDLIEVRL